MGIDYLTLYDELQSNMDGNYFSSKTGANFKDEFRVKA
jgi:hypothetical protein